jgi:hypothetical protein
MREIALATETTDLDPVAGDRLLPTCQWPANQLLSQINIAFDWHF